MVFVSKCRYKVFRNEFTKKTCECAFHEVAEKYGIEIKELEFQLDHVHLMVHIPAKLSVSYTVQLLKGISARRISDASSGLRKRYPRGSFWQVQILRHSGTYDRGHCEEVYRSSGCTS